MKRIRTINGYTIYEATTQRDADTYNCEVGSYNIYLSTDIRDYGLTNSYPEYENIDSLAVALAMCSDSHYGVAVALADELSDSTVQDMDLTLEIERRLESGEALETIRRCYDREAGRLYESIADAIAHGYDPYANDEFDPYEDHPAVGYDEDGKPHIVEDECEWDEDDLDGDLEDVFETAMAHGDLADQNLDYDYDETDLLRRAMCAAGYAYDGLNSDGHLAFYDEMCEHIYFLTWPAVREWLEGVVFDDPEVSDNVERILHPERFDGTRLYDKVHDRMTEDDYSTPETFEARLHAIAEELSLTDEDIDGFMGDYLLWYEGNPQIDPEYNRHEQVDPAEFVEDLFRNELLYNEPTPITLDEAEHNLQEYYEAGLEVPYDLTAELLQEEWNDLCEKLHPAKQERRSHACYYVVRDDEGDYMTRTVPFEGNARQHRYAFFRTVANQIAFNDCSYETVEEIVYDGEPCHYTGWQPGMVIEFASDITGEIVYSGSFPEWDH